MYSLVLMMALSGSGEVPTAHNCNGCNGCCGGYSCHGCCGGGSCHGCCGGCHGCHGCHGCCGGGCCGGTAPAPAAPAKPAGDMPKPGEAAKAAPAFLIVTLPADAKLTIDGKATRSTSAIRSFVTPALDSGKSFAYSLTAEVVRDGQKFTTTRRVMVRGGVENRITLDIPVTSVAQN